MAINTTLSTAKCWKMVNRVSTLEQAKTAEAWLRANEVISNDEYNDLMMALSYIVRELHHGRW